MMHLERTKAKRKCRKCKKPIPPNTTIAVIHTTKSIGEKVYPDKKNYCRQCSLTVLRKATEERELEIIKLKAWWVKMFKQEKP